MAVVEALRREDPARILPVALATLCAIVGAIGGAKMEPGDFLEDWGVITPDEAAERNAAESIANLRALAARFNARKDNA